MGDTRTVRVKVPATSANCGPGFDSLGFACTMYNEFSLKLTEKEGLKFEITGDGADAIPADEHNVVWRSARYLLEHTHFASVYKGGVITMHNIVPLSRGLGSSATAIVAGLKAANALIGNPFGRRDLLQFATRIEGHPDNVAPAIFGGFTVSTTYKGRAQTFSFLPKLRLTFVAAVPDFTLPTKVAREVLPETVTREDAIFNISRAAMLVAALLEGNAYFLRNSLYDAIHEPYRMKLIPGMQEVFYAAKKAGALGATLSGAGPTLMAYTLERDKAASTVADAMIKAFERNGIHAKAHILSLDTRGASVLGGFL
ncbi:MAG: homoserine kinase [Selenomonadaceae bacterium]|nr:homoserine kinase [Selenomonadaceae bacterium]